MRSYVVAAANPNAAVTFTVPSRVRSLELPLRTIVSLDVPSV